MTGVSTTRASSFPCTIGLLSPVSERCFPLRLRIFSDKYIKQMWVKLAFSALLFYAFVPGVLVNLSTPFTSPALTHAILFALVSGFVWKAAKPMLPKY